MNVKRVTQKNETLHRGQVKLKRPRVILSEKLELRKMKGEGRDFLGLRRDLEYPEKWKTICPPKPWLRYVRLRQFIDLIAYFIYQTVSFPRFGCYHIQVSFWSVSKEGNLPHEVVNKRRRANILLQQCRFVERHL